jgi:signal transduction histidine kinase
VRDGGVAAAMVATAAPEDEEESRYVPPPPDPLRDDRIRRIQIDGQPFGHHVEHEGQSLYAYAVPIRDEQGNVVAAIDLTRDESDAERALAATQQAVAFTVLLIGAGLALLVWITTRRAISHPLQRLVEGIDEVSHGDLTRAILRERDDEIGDLADRFNQMTQSLREARTETERSGEARLALEQRLRQSEKLATIGQLAATIAHEVGTPLGVIGGRARTMEKKAADQQEVAKNAGIIAAQTERIKRIIERLLDYARKKVATRSAIDLASVVYDCVDLLEHQLTIAGVVVRVQPFVVEDAPLPAAGVATPPPPSLPVVLADADELQQVLLNLLVNAIQSMPRGGAIEIALRGLVRRKPGLDMAPPGRYVLMQVADEGVGIPLEDRERIFEPFYSTKQGEGGTGLGLAVSLGIVKDHDGWIEIDAAPQQGSVFRVFLPAPDIEGDGIQ